MTNANTPSHSLSHLVFCALVALAFERQQGGAATPMAEHLFIVRWLATAQKQKRFPKNVAVDITWMLERGRRHGQAAKLRAHLEYLWSSSCGMGNQTPLFRLTFAIETLRDRGWRNVVLLEPEWSLLPSSTSGQANHLFVEKTALSAAYTQNGQQIQPVVFLVSGDVADMVAHLAGYNLTCVIEGQAGDYHRVVLLPAEG
ncbi:hypothetical protein D3C79_312510 [compost metagenome]